MKIIDKIRVKYTSTNGLKFSIKKGREPRKLKKKRRKEMHKVLLKWSTDPNRESIMINYPGGEIKVK